MKNRWLVLIAQIPLIAILAMGAWDNTLPSDSIAWNVGAGHIRNNNDALEVVLGIGLNMESSAVGWYEAAAPTTTADLSTALSATYNGMLWVDSDDNTLYHYVYPSWVAITQGTVTVPRVSGLEQYFRFNTVDPSTLQGNDGEYCFAMNIPAAMTITKIEVTADADPTTELDANIMWGTAFIGLAGETLVAAINTTNGTAEVTSFDDATIPLAGFLWLKYDATPDVATTQFLIQVTWDYD